MPDRCPHCGSLVRVHTAGEGTCSYEPVAEQAIRKALDVIAWRDVQVRMPERQTPSQVLEAVTVILRRGLGETTWR